jgi:hypothetical protein
MRTIGWLVDRHAGMVAVAGNPINTSATALVEYGVKVDSKSRNDCKVPSYQVEGASTLRLESQKFSWVQGSDKSHFW